jgi:hypothetical protein
VPRWSVTAQATAARAHLEAGLDALGLMDNFVPVQCFGGSFIDRRNITERRAAMLCRRRRTRL